MKNVIDFTKTTDMLCYFDKWRSKGRCISGAYRFHGKMTDYYISNVNRHVTDFVIFVVPCGQRFDFSCEKFLIVGTFLCVLQFLKFRESDSFEHFSDVVSNSDDVPF